MKYRDAYISGYSEFGSEDIAAALSKSTVASVESLAAGWHVIFVASNKKNESPQKEYFLHVYIKLSGELDKIERGPDR